MNRIILNYKILGSSMFCNGENNISSNYVGICIWPFDDIDRIPKKLNFLTDFILTVANEKEFYIIRNEAYRNEELFAFLNEKGIKAYYRLWGKSPTKHNIGQSVVLFNTVDFDNLIQILKNFWFGAGNGFSILIFKDISKQQNKELNLLQTDWAKGTEFVIKTFIDQILLVIFETDDSDSIIIYCKKELVEKVINTLESSSFKYNIRLSNSKTL